MINLLPQEERSHLHTTYRLRVTAVALMFAIAFEIILFVLFLPAFYEIYLSTKDLNATLIEKKAAVPKDIEAIQAQVNGLKTEIDLLKGGKDVTPSHIVDLISAARNDGVTVWGVVYEKSKNEIQIRGFAVSRDSLTQFRKNLREVQDFSSADVPPSILLKDTAIDFTMKISLR